MSAGKIYAVLTGDLIGYSDSSQRTGKEYWSVLKAAFGKLPPDMIASNFPHFQGGQLSGSIVHAR